MAVLWRALSVSWVAFAMAQEQCDERICGRNNGASYRGCQTKTKSGRTCQGWEVQSPHTHSRTASRYPGFGLSSNYCRNPDGEPTIWCFTTDPEKTWEFCEVKKHCDETISTSDKGASYRGCQTKTKSGRHCQAWASQAPHTHGVTPHRYQGAGLVGSYCRNPDGEPTIWCFTTDPEKQWELCGSNPGGDDQSGGGGGDSSGGGFGRRSGKNGWVDDHNYFRSLHKAGEVTWDNDLEKKAIDHAKLIKRKGGLFHSDSYNDWPPSGENLAMGYGSSCSAAHRDGGPKLYDGGYDQHCAMASWYGEYYLWKGRGDWQTVAGLGHFTALVWKGIDTIGCASNGNYHVCEYGSTQCRAKNKQYGGSECWNSHPSHLPNFNMGQCSGGKCVQGLFNLSTGLEEILEEEPVAGAAGMLAMGTGVTMLLAGAVLVVRRLRAHSPVTDGGDQELLCTSPATGLEA